jgi:hypothetical protein
VAGGDVQDFHQGAPAAAAVILNTTAESTYAAPRAIAGDPRVSPPTVPLSHRRTGFCTMSASMCRPGRWSASSASGSGKSTFAKLVSASTFRRADAWSTDLGWPTSRLRRQIGVVLQENVLFNRRCAEYRASPGPGHTIERIIAAAHLAGAHE